MNLPDAPGVYLFKKGRRILYIGKAGSVRDRVRSYFAPDLAEGRGSRIVGMVADASSLSWQKTGSVLEALILEANLIKRHQPPYNVDQKDNKSWNYVVITKEVFPRVLVIRGRELYSGSLAAKRYKTKAMYGPFPHGGQLKEALNMVRRIFPFRDSRCAPCNELGTYQGDALLARRRLDMCKPCFNRQIGLCPGVCSGEVSKEEYAHTVRNIKDLFSAKFKGLKLRLAREMKVATKTEDFERAETLRRQVLALEHIRDVALIKGERIASGGGLRIEAFDVAHTSGSETVAVMTVVSNGEAMKNAYRKFTIRSAKNDDVASLTEALARRLAHPEWPLPRIFVVDGGRGQVNAALRVLRGAGVEIPVVGVVKNEFHKPERFIGDPRIIAANEKDILLANSEAHRFGITWHRFRRQRSMV
ncbi:MAG: Excinuclease ABC, C subunit [Candidatus Kaiserbacteria bacterium GW2011_GWA2_58_9]|uniref:Excinuclease ABC, C subunit n=1 Tax=Candidatus Kaiserbacteria bacterium GW2011_GWA2_58_9 TaxID=1618672 RepID=A0A0G1YVJ1_9BACT|nr:MAG: Excinuclease ABC, C subunit [Candidatus Kaiserbacteria bacterium GW2011_GWA2_58_9]